MTNFVSGKTASFKTLGGPIGSEYKGVVIDIADMTYRTAIKLDPNLHARNAELYQYINEDPIDLKDKRFFSFDYLDETNVFCLDWVVYDSIVLDDLLKNATINIEDISVDEAKFVVDYVKRMGYKASLTV